MRRPWRMHALASDVMKGGGMHVMSHMPCSMGLSLCLSPPPRAGRIALNGTRLCGISARALGQRTHTTRMQNEYIKK